MSNRLKNESSPYLRQHGDNPVDWYPWCAEAFEKAGREDKPVFLSIGYSTCHWCHVMAHESFEDAEAADILNRGYVCIKVDREERPDIDAVYMSVCQAINGSGGWPLTVIMTPEQKPFFAGTYFPKRSRYGQPGLIQLLTEISRLWRNDRQRLLSLGDRIMSALEPAAEPVQTEPDNALLHRAYSYFRDSFDAEWGGFGTAPKFPAAHNLLFLLHYARRMKEPQAAAMAEKTLKAMAHGGIFDNISGGFSRYSTDRKWLIPHFEKMLYDNALLLIAYVSAYQATGDAEYADIARRTADYILRELSDEKGGFYCGQDADSEGVEGKYYVFTPEEIISVLGREDGGEFCRLYGIGKKPNFEGGSVPNRIDAQGAVWAADDPRICRLHRYRKERTSLHRDEKILLSWNAWTIIALAQAGIVLSETRYLSAAMKAQRFIEESMTDKNGRLLLSLGGSTGQLDDYAVYALALLSLYRASFDAEYLKAAIRRAEQITELFEDEKGGYFMYAHDAEALISRPKELYDGAIPSGNSVAAMVFEELAALTGETKWRERSDRQLGFIAGRTERYPAGSSFALLAMAKRLMPGRELVCVSECVPTELTEYLKANAAYELSVLYKSTQNSPLLAECAPFTEAYPVPEKGACWYLCENGACHAPQSEFPL